MLRSDFLRNQAVFFFGVLCVAGGVFSAEHLLAAEFPARSPLVLNKEISSGNILAYARAYQDIREKSYEQLAALSTELSKEESFLPLREQIRRALEEKKDSYIFREEIFIGHVPTAVDKPFYEQDKRERNIKYFQPESEYLYFDNLRLQYENLALVKQKDERWIFSGKATPLTLKARTAPTPSGVDSIDKAVSRFCWDYKVPDDYVHDFVSMARQWGKRYQESLTTPILYNGMLLVRNEHRIFAVERESGKLLWSLGNPALNGSDYYHTFRPFHHNSYGSEFLLSQDMIVTELDGSLMAVSLKDPLHPVVVWAKSLGEYTLASQPVRDENVFIAGVINARGELWFSGFDVMSGSLKWSRYIGLSSFFSPVSVISVCGDGEIFIGTNHGALVALESRTGRVLWIKKYSPRKYKAFDFWEKKIYNDKITGKGSIAYDTQFIELGQGRKLYYKPRESDFFYVLNTEDGSSSLEIQIDRERFYLLNVLQEKAVFLENSPQATGHSELKIVDLNSGDTLWSKTVKGRDLKGVLRLGESRILFKTETTAHLLEINEKIFDYKEVGEAGDGWLLHSDGMGIVTGNALDVSLFDMFDRGALFKKSTVATDAVARKSELKEVLTRAIEQDNPALVDDIVLSDIRKNSLSLEDVFEVIAKHRKQIHGWKWKHVFSALQDVFKDEVVLFHGIDMRFDHFLQAEGILDKAEDKVADEKVLAPGVWPIRISAGNIFPVPVKIIKGPTIQKYFVFSFYDQFVCVDESGNALWKKKLFYGGITYGKSERDRLVLFSNNIDAYLYNDVLIFNDSVNVVAVNVRNGEYVWSLSNKKNIITGPLENAPGITRKWPSEAGVFFQRNIQIRTRFADGRLLLFHGRRVYLVDPETGYCDKYKEIDGGIAAEALAAGHLYIIPSSLDRIIVFRLDLDEERSLPIKKVLSQQAGVLELIAAEQFLAIHVSKKIFLIDQKSGDLKQEIGLEGIKQYFVEPYSHGILVIRPFQGVDVYDLSQDVLSPPLRLAVTDADRDFSWKSSTDYRPQYYFLAKDNVLMLTRKSGKYFMVNMDILAKKILWERSLEKAEGLFFYLSNGIFSEECLNFIVSTTHMDEFCNEKTQYRNACDPVAVDIDSIFFQLRLNDGKVLQTRVGPSLSAAIFKKDRVLETRKHFCSGIGGVFVEIWNK